MYDSIRYNCRSSCAASVVILIHPWKGSWASVHAEDVYGYSNFVFTNLSVKEAKMKAKLLKKYIQKEYKGGGSVTCLDVVAARQWVEERMPKVDSGNYSVAS